MLNNFFTSKSNFLKLFSCWWLSGLICQSLTNAQGPEIKSGRIHTEIWSFQIFKWLRLDKNINLGGGRGLEAAHWIAAREVRGSNLSLGRIFFSFSALNREKLRFRREPRQKSHARRQICQVDGRARLRSRARRQLMEMTKQVRSQDRTNTREEPFSTRHEATCLITDVSNRPVGFSTGRRGSGLYICRVRDASP